MTHPSRITTVNAFILKRKNVGDSDKVLTLFTKTTGKVRVVAKGVRKITSRRGPYLDIFNEIKITLHQGKSWDTVSEVDMLVSRRNAYTTWMRMRAAYVIVEAIDKLLPDNEPQRAIYDKLGAILVAIGTASDSEITPLLVSFFNALLEELGYLAPDKKYSEFGELIGYIERISERKIRSMKFFLS
ncbi:MAG: DNA repair protein RecO [Microgenomates group bacterium]